ncbi:MAG: zinc metallopeptidase [Epulopiscium sp.]|nr:zinc metallopeptidase [Candidatus Epulonipiscium sp.]
MYGFWGMDPISLMILLPAVILSLYAQTKVTSTFQRYLKVPNAQGYTGAEVARRILEIAGIRDVRIEPISGSLTDHYDPRSKVLRLSEPVFHGRSVAALGVAAHEAGHAIQHNEGYVFLNIRSAIVPIVSIGSRLAMPLILIGLLFGAMASSLGAIFIQLGIYLFAGVVLFQVITLPVEFNASSRAITFLDSYGFLTTQEVKPAKKVLDAAALTYVASAAVALANLLRFIVLFGDNGRRRD